MKRALLLLSFCIAIPVGSSWAAVIGTTTAAALDPNDTVDWCQTGCAGGQIDPSQVWTALFGLDQLTVSGTGGASPYNIQQGTPAWPGNFADGMGLVYNGVDNGSAPDSITIHFSQAEMAVGAYIQSDVFGGFSATIEMFDILGHSLGSFTTPNGNSDSDSDEATALFLGGFSSTAVWSVTFSATGDGADLVPPTLEPNFAIGTMRLGLGDLSSCPFDDDFCKEVEDEIPEPASLLLMTPALLGLVAFTRRRKG